MRMAGVVLAAAVLVGAAAGCREEKSAASAERVVRIVSMQPRKMEFVRKVRIQGNVESKESAEISSRTDGNLDLLPISEGQHVKPGDVLFQVDRENLENDVKGQKQKLEVAEAELKIAEINRELAATVMEKARVDFERSERLAKAKAVSEDAHERAILNLEEARANVLKAEAQANYAKARVGQEQADLEIARKTLSDSLVRAPFDGVVTVKSRDRDEYVKPGDVILRLESPDRLELVSMISSVYYDEVVPGRTMAVVYGENGKKAGELPVTFRSPSVDALSRTFTIKIDVPASFRLVSGQLCEIDLVLEKAEGSGVPSQAVLDRRDNRRAVFTVAPGGTAQSVDVRTGIVDGGWTMLTDPAVLGGRPVVVEGQAFLENGDRVEEMAASSGEVK